MECTGFEAHYFKCYVPVHNIYVHVEHTQLTDDILHFL
jgi:hypothetical protein